MNRISFLLGALALFSISACKPAENASKAPTTQTTNHSSGNPVTAPVDYLGAVSKGQRNSEATINLASTKQAIQMFNVTEGRYPKDLDELVSTGYLTAKPKMPSGQKLTYNAADGTLIVEPAN